jgi:hypothetical protein
MLNVLSHWSFSLDLHELWSKEGAGVKLNYLTPDRKSLENRGQMKSDWNMLYPKER